MLWNAQDKLRYAKQVKNNSQLSNVTNNYNYFLILFCKYLIYKESSWLWSYHCDSKPNFCFYSYIDALYVAHWTNLIQFLKPDKILQAKTESSLTYSMQVGVKICSTSTMSIIYQAKWNFAHCIVLIESTTWKIIGNIITLKLNFLKKISVEPINEILLGPKHWRK